jgi:hypothetical protein
MLLWVLNGVAALLSGTVLADTVTMRRCCMKATQQQAQRTAVTDTLNRVAKVCTQ